MTRPRSTTAGPARQWRVVSEAAARSASGSAATLLRLAQSATLASAAGVRSMLDLTRTPLTRTPLTRSVAPAPTQDATPDATLEPAVDTTSDTAVDTAVDTTLDSTAAPTPDAVLPAGEDVAPSPAEPADEALDDRAPEDGDVDSSEEIDEVNEVEAEGHEDPESAEAEDLEGPLVPHWDELNLARIRGRLPRLSLDEISSLLDYEREHAARPPVLTLLENRIRKLQGKSADEPAEQDPASSEE